MSDARLRLPAQKKTPHFGSALGDTTAGGSCSKDGSALKSLPIEVTRAASASCSATSYVVCYIVFCDGYSCRSFSFSRETRFHGDSYGKH